MAAEPKLQLQRQQLLHSANNQLEAGIKQQSENLYRFQIDENLAEQLNHEEKEIKDNKLLFAVAEWIKQSKLRKTEKAQIQAQLTEEFCQNINKINCQAIKVFFQQRLNAGKITAFPESHVYDIVVSALNKRYCYEELPTKYLDYAKQFAPMLLATTGANAGDLIALKSDFVTDFNTAMQQHFAQQLQTIIQSVTTALELKFCFNGDQKKIYYLANDDAYEIASKELLQELNGFIDDEQRLTRIITERSADISTRLSLLNQLERKLTAIVNTLKNTAIKNISQASIKPPHFTKESTGQKPYLGRLFTKENIVGSDLEICQSLLQKLTVQIATLNKLLCCVQEYHLKQIQSSETHQQNGFVIDSFTTTFTKLKQNN